MAEVTKILPTQPFDGQEFIDSFRMKWIFSSESDCWRRVGTVPDLPVATELQSGLLSAKLKQLLDSIPERGGHFGILAHPLLSLVNTNAEPLCAGKIKQAFQNESGTQLRTVPNKLLSTDQFAGKGILFKSGLLKNKLFLIFTNDQTDFYIDGDARAAALDDEFSIINPADLNANGILLGDIMLVSDSIDINCIDAKGIPFSQDSEALKCGARANQPDGTVPGFDLTVNKNFLDQFCVVIPGCKGPKGDRGDKGLSGKDGTGDGPIGEIGDPGDDAPTTPHIFTGIKVIDIDDVYDMAVVGMELDAPNNRINLIKAKVRTPDSTRPADQVIASPIVRNIQFTDEGTFNFGLQMPDADPIGSADVDVLIYPASFNPAASTGQPTTQVQTVKLSAIISNIAKFWDSKLREINDQYNQVLKAYVEDKDKAARMILATLAQEVAECEFQLPIEFCVGISPNECHQQQPPPKNFPLCSSIFGPNFTTPPGTPGTPTTPGAPSVPTSVDLGTYTIPATVLGPTGAAFISVKYPSVSDPTASNTLPIAGYVIQYEGGSIKSSDTDWLVGSVATDTGLEVRFRTTGGVSGIRKMPIPTAIFNPKEKLSVEKAYREAPIFEKIVSILMDTPGTIDIKACLPGVDPQGAISVKVLAVFKGSALPSGSSHGILDDTTAVTIVPAPAVGSFIIKSMTVFNTDTAPVELHVVLQDTATSNSTIFLGTLAVGDEWVFGDADDAVTLDSPTKSIIAFLSSPAATKQPEFTAAYTVS